MVEECAGTRLGILDKELATVFAPDFCMSAACNLALEGQCDCILGIQRFNTGTRSVTVRESAYLKEYIAFFVISHDGFEVKRAIRFKWGRRRMRCVRDCVEGVTEGVDVSVVGG